MKPKSSKFLAEDVTSYLGYLKFWSFAGFQHFLGSAIVSHMAEAIKAGTGKVVPALERRTGRQSSISEYMGGVSSRQLQKFLSLIPGDVAEKREFWEGFEIWSRYSALWDDLEPDWLELDDWREEMGLERLNPVRLLGPYGKLLVFRRLANRCAPPETPPEGYRFANLDDLKKVADIPKGENRTVCKVGGEWNFVSMGWGISAHWVRQVTFTDAAADPRMFFCQNTVFVPLVEL